MSSPSSVGSRVRWHAPFSAILLALLLVLTADDVVSAQEPEEEGPRVAFSIGPVLEPRGETTSSGYFVHGVEPGDAVRDEARVTNEGDQPVLLDVYVASATTAVNGGTAFGARDTSANGAAGWLTLDITNTMLQPGETRVVSFVIAVPEDASPGEHVAGLLVEQTPTEAGTEPTETPQFSVRVVQRSGVAVVIDVAGDRRSELEISALGLERQSEEGSTFEIGVSNTGNTMVSGRGSLRVADSSGQEVAELPVSISTVLPGDSTSFLLHHPTQLELGRYVIEGAIEYCALRDDTQCGSVFSTSMFEVVEEDQGRDAPSTQDTAQPTRRDGGSSRLGLVGVGIAMTLAAGAGVAFLLWRRRGAI